MAVLSSMFHHWELKLLGTFSAFILYLLSYAIYNIYFHPLSKYPGPKRWAATRASYVFSLYSGWLHSDVHDIHRRYGDIVRIAPNEISFARPEAWQDIYANVPGRPAFPKSQLWHGAPGGRASSVLNALDIKVHSRFRKAMDPAFVDKAVRMQEPVVLFHLQIFISQLDKLVSESSEGAVVDIVRWLSYLVFDAIGDLGFGEPFGCLERSEYHPWCSMIFSSLRAATYRVSLRYYPALNWIMSLFIPKNIMKKQMEHWKLAEDKINRRLNLEKERPDLISMIKRDDEGVNGLSYPEMKSTAAVLIVAGSETSITVLSGTTNFLVKNPDKLALLQNEIRATFKNESDFTSAVLRDLPYLNAVLNEGLRLCNPTPVGAPRITPPGGGIVAGERLPEDVFVNAHALTVSRSPDSFHDPGGFHPERWLDEKDACFENDQLSAIQPFGVGPRSCIGKPLAWVEMRLILARLVWRFDLLPADTEAGRLQWDQQRTFTVVERQPFEVRLRRRAGLSAVE
ncbi:cytochrome P450 [Aaosphaeria arxii CBS 175.79]|uniref:Cytochrome P450 n=1 Tax=Aaosphaeria arxii CBS 175.79 TaxID=1450172 RepID=A0A6A5XG06_9PLEO|nr:cytochrome P450 [Aaosphaeria arxii CBS 175.79]KAF2012098.1 cytochrome P450 [Aaosphaeria arxii CBS 175.79]